MTNVGLEMIKMFEQFRGTAYQDSVGVWTVGYGETGPDVKYGTTRSMVEAESFLRQEAQALEDAIKDLLKDRAVSPNDWEIDALVSFAYNLGLGALRKSTLFKLYKDYDNRGAMAEFRKWKYAGGKPLLGLRKRRFAEAVRFLGGDFDMVTKAYNGVASGE